MAKIIKYKYLSGENDQGNVENVTVEQIALTAEIICPTQAAFAANYPIAEKEAIPGTIVIDGEFDPEPVAEPTADEILNALLGVSEE